MLLESCQKPSRPSIAGSGAKIRIRSSTEICCDDRIIASLAGNTREIDLNGQTITWPEALCVTCLILRALASTDPRSTSLIAAQSEVMDVLQELCLPF